MEINKAILNAFTKQLYLYFKNKKFKLDLNEGDLHDYWNAITTDDGVEYDVNFVWNLKPTVIIYRCGCSEQQYNNEIVIVAHEVIGTRETYFETKPLNNKKKQK